MNMQLARHAAFLAANVQKFWHCTDVDDRPTNHVVQKALVIICDKIMHKLISHVINNSKKCILVRVTIISMYVRARLTCAAAALDS